MLPFSKLTKKLEFAAGNSDHLTMLNAYRVSVGQNRAYVTILKVNKEIGICCW